MLPIEVNPQLIAPMRSIYQNWSLDQTLNMDWYFDISIYLKAQKIVFPFIDFDSPLFDEIQQSTLARNIKPSFVMLCSDFLKLKKRRSFLSSDIEINLVIDHWPEPIEFSEIKDIALYQDNIKFVIVARNDWDFVTLYRSLPFWMREKIYIDFPTSLHESDPFLTETQAAEISIQLKNFFPDIELKSFSPDIRLYSENQRAGIKLLSLPPKLNIKKPKLSLVIKDKKTMLALSQSLLLQELGDRVEILYLRFLSEPSFVIPKIKSVTTTTYCFDNQPSEISQGLIHNFCLSQSSAEKVLFINQDLAQNWDSVWSKTIKDLIGSDEQRGSFVLQETSQKESFLPLFCFKKQVADFGGYDHLLRSSQALQQSPKTISTLGSLSEKKSAKFQSQLTFQDRKILKVKKMDSLKSSMVKIKPLSPVDVKIKKIKVSQQMNEIYFRLWQNKPQVILESHISLIKKPLRFFYQNYYWRIKSLGWRFKVLGMLIYSHLWRISPRQIGWIIFKLALPLRKIYYFLNFQYQKRILGLHKSEKTL